MSADLYGNRDGKIAGSQYQERLGRTPPGLPGFVEFEKLLEAGRTK